MFKKLPFLLLILVLTSPVFSQQLTKADYLEDLQYLKDTLPKRHINLFAKISKADFEQTLQAMAARLNNPDRESFITELYKLPVAIGDEHTFIEADFSQVLPVRFEVFSEGLFVTAAEPVHKDILLYRLTGINGHSLAEVISRFKTVIQNSNPSFFQTHMLQYLSNPVLLKGLQLSASTDEVTFELTGPEGQTTTRVIRSVPGSDPATLPLAEITKRPMARMDTANYWYRYLPQSGILYFRYNKCQDENQHPFAKFNEELFAAIAEHSPKRLVIDLRYNGGGNSGVLGPFIERLRESKLNRKGKLYVLIGKATFSSALMNAVELKRTTGAILVGEATSGTVNHYGEVRGFGLPHTKIGIAYSTRYWETWKGHDGPLKPDVNLSYSVKNFEKGADEALLYVERLR